MKTLFQCKENQIINKYLYWQPNSFRFVIWKAKFLKFQIFPDRSQTSPRENHIVRSGFTTAYQRKRISSVTVVSPKMKLLIDLEVVCGQV